MLVYVSLLYHHVTLKFARHMGYEVRFHFPSALTPLEAETLFNSYLSRLLELEQIESPDFRFHFQNDPGLGRIYVNAGKNERPVPLLPGNSDRWFHGMMVIQRK